MATTQDSVRWEPMRRYLEESVQRGAFPGGVVAVGRRDTVLYLHAFGQTMWDGGVPVTTETMYDLASLTKVIGLTTAVMMLVEEGRLGLDSPAAHYLGEPGSRLGPAITVRRLLTHSAGFPAWQPYWDAVDPGERGRRLGEQVRLGSKQQREAIFRAAAQERLTYPTGTRMIYSDIGVIVLTEIVERLAGERLDRFLNGRLFEPLGMTSTRFVPPESWRQRIAPTEVDTIYRHRLVHGEVHDERAFAMQGVSGHAGMFGSAPDLVRFAQMMLGNGNYRRDRRSGGQNSQTDTAHLVRAETIAEFTRVQDSALSHRALGWETPNGQNSAGTRLSARAFGHTGFTGTSMWMDLEHDLFVILLTNRVHPTRENTLIIEVRRRVAELAVEAAGVR